jgi:S-layer homology domain
VPERGGRSSFGCRCRADFNDVPTSHPFFQFIEALYHAGITGGCQTAPPMYCPDAPLTRGQMAVFLAKGLGLQWP